MQSTKLRFTYRDYLLLPEGDGRELIEGDFHVVPAPSIWHQTIAANLGMALRAFVRSNRLGAVLWAPTDVVLSPESVVQPDILFISNERRNIIAEDNVSGAPILWWRYCRRARRSETESLSGRSMRGTESASTG